MIRHPTAVTLLAAGLVLLPGSAGAAQAQTGDSRPEDTEIWEPVPPIVTPGPAGSPNPPPSDALVLFGGSDLDAWVNERDGSPAGWPVHDGVFTVDNESGNIRTRQSFQDYQLHLEWRVPEGVQGRGQTRGNSGLFLSTGGRWGYEVQILEANDNETYVNGMAGSVYKQSIPLANPARPPGEWQVYDVLWRAPRFDEDGELATPARVTVIFNGVVVQDAFELQGQTRWIGPPVYQSHGPSPILLQAHGDPGPMVSFRNIWLRELR
jgi:hypothetical protein